MTWLPQFRRIAVVVLSTLLPPCCAIAQLGSPSVPSQSFGGASRIAGTIVNAVGGTPLVRARVSIISVTNPQDRQSTVTAEDGHFEFKQVAPGKWSMVGAKRGFITAAYEEHEQFSTAIVAGAGLDTGHLVLRIAPSAILAGRVLDESGDPVRNASVTLFRENRRTGVGRIESYGNSPTDDQGTYEFTRLDSGTYFVSASATPWYAVHPISSHEPDAGIPLSMVDRSMDVAYPITYYGDSTESDEATPIPIRGGDRLRADIHLTPLPALHLLVHLSEDGPRGISMPVFQESTFDGSQMLRTGEIQSISPGLFEITGIAPGRYNVRMPSSAPGQENRLSESVIDATTDGQELDSSSGSPAATIKATVEEPGAANLPKFLAVALRNSKMRTEYGREINDKGEVEFEDVKPDKYEVLAGTPGKSYSIARISSPGSDNAGHILNMPAGASLVVKLTLAGGSADVEGLAQRAGKGSPGAMVVLVPKDPEAHLDLFRRDQSDLDGTFKLPSVISGSYTVVAIENGWDLDWSRPAVIAHYCKHGQTITISDHAMGVLHLPSALEVQSR